MMIRLLLISLLTFPGAAQAMEPMVPAGLLPTENARPLLEQDPGVAAARAGLNVALQEAGVLDKSPYEWTARAAGLQRRVESGPRYGEWNVGIERTIRLPGKATADRNIGKATVEESKARYGEALRAAARELLALWVDWLAAERTNELAADNLRSVQDNLDAVNKRFRAGDASKLDLNIARAELAEQRRMNTDAITQAAVARSRLFTRFPGVNHQVLALPAPLSSGEKMEWWRDRILMQSDELKILQAQLQKAQANAERARADMTPDPTLGAYMASEFGGRELISGVTISIPIPGDLRNSRSAMAIAAIEVSRREIAVKTRQLEADIASAVAASQGTHDGWQIANEGAAAVQENAALMQRAYALGEAELQALLLARRQAIAATNSALQAQVTALKAYCALLVNAHWIWDLDHE